MPRFFAEIHPDGEGTITTGPADALPGSDHAELVVVEGHRDLRGVFAVDLHPGFGSAGGVDRDLPLADLDVEMDRFGSLELALHGASC